MKIRMKMQGCILTALFALMLGAGALLFFLLPKEDYSEAERRHLADAPELSLSSVVDGRFFAQTDRYLADHFEGRELFRGVKAFWQTKIMREKENNGLTVVDGSIVKLEKTVNEGSLSYVGGRFRAIYEKYLTNTDCKLYCALVPDKSAFLAARGYPVMDLSRMEELFYNSLPEAQPIALDSRLSLADYYNTDSHWRQEAILPAANLLLSSMGRAGDIDPDEFEAKTYAPFYGVYAGQSALFPDPDVITYLDGGPLENVYVFDYGAMSETPLYDPDSCDKRDPYTLFLGGAKGLLHIENPNVTDGSRLIVFRDSFGSSLAPLLAARYGSVTLIDTRYIDPSLLSRYMRFENADVLFLYSATLLNDSQGVN